MSSSTGKITDRYFETTSERSGSVDDKGFSSAMATAARRLGGWMPGPGAAVLDLGCGMGELCQLARQHGAASVVGVNLCEEEVQMARARVPGEFIRADITDYLKQEQRQFDWIGCLNILEHLPKDRIVETLQLARGRLKPGGCLVAMVPNAVSPMASMTRHWDFTHEWAFTPNNFRQLARLCGYEEPEFRECGPLPHGLVSGLRYAAWRVLHAMIAAYLLIEVASRKDGIYTADMLVRLRAREEKPG